MTHLVINNKRMLRFTSEGEFNRWKTSEEKARLLREHQMKVNEQRRLEGQHLSRLARNEEDLKAQYIAGEIEVEELEDALDIIYGIPRKGWTAPSYWVRPETKLDKR